MDLSKVKRDDWVLAGVALLLALTLLLFPWFSVSVLSITINFTATGAPDGWIGVLALLCSLGIVVDLAIERFSPQTHLPVLGDSRETTRFVLAVATAALLALKFVLHIHFSLFGWGFYLAVLLVVALVFFADQLRRGEALSVPARFQGVTGGGATGTATGSGASAPPAAPSEPAASPPPQSSTLSSEQTPPPSDS
jgi:hypothetical protein